MERTFAIIKPDAVGGAPGGPDHSAHRRGGIPDSCHADAPSLQKEAEGFYAVHRERPFFGSLTTFMSSGPVVVMALEAPDAIKKWRTLMGATDPAKADAGTLRKEFGESIENNATHGSDAPETAAFELGYFFAGVELASWEVRWASCWSSSGLVIAGIGPADDGRRAASGGCPGDFIVRRGNVDVLLSAGDVDLVSIILTLLFASAPVVRHSS